MSKIFNQRLPPEQKLELAKEAFGISGGIPSEKSVKKIYRKLAAKYHPDKGTEPDVERFKKIAAAKEILDDAVADPKRFPVGGLLSTDEIVASIRMEGSGAHQEVVLRQLENPAGANRDHAGRTIRIIEPNLPNSSFGQRYIAFHYPSLVDQPAVKLGFADFKTRLAMLKAELTHHEPLNVFPGESNANIQRVKSDQFAYALSRLPNSVKTNPEVIRHAKTIATTLNEIADAYETHSLGLENKLTSRIGVPLPADKQRELLRLSPQIQRAAKELEQKIDDAELKYRGNKRAADENYDSNKDKDGPWMRFLRLHNAKGRDWVDRYDMHIEQAITNYQARQRRPNKDRVAAEAKKISLVETAEKSLDEILTIFHNTVSGSKTALGTGIRTKQGKLGAGPKRLAH